MNVHVERRAARMPDLVIGLTPLPTVKHWHDCLTKDFDSAGDSLILQLLQEYVTLRQRIDKMNR